MGDVNRRRLLTSSALSAPMLGLTGASAATPERSARRVRTGADVLAADGWRSLTGRVGVIANPTAVLSASGTGLPHIVDDMRSSGSVNLVAVFGPEHGFRGTSQAGGSEGDYTDPRTGLPVYDTYDADAARIADMFRQAGVDRVVFDIADVGARFYTYIWTMYTAMRAAVRAGISFVVLDRPNPLSGDTAGPRLDPAYSSFVGMLPIVQQHGMTVGELARLFDGEYLPDDAGGRLRELEVARVRGWSRSDPFDGTGLPWVLPSPNMPTPDTAAVYPGTGMFEGTVLSEGRGTTRPFEIVGAPGIDWRWAERLNSAGLPGVEFRETYFVPTFSKHSGKTCGGVQIHRTGRDFEPIRTAVEMIVSVRRLHPDVFGWRPDRWIDTLTGSARLRRMVDAGAGTDEIVGAWRDELAEFRRLRGPYLLYR